MSLLTDKKFDLRLASLFSDHMVLQRNLPLTVWGWAQPREKVAVRIQGQETATRADKNGRWKVGLKPLRAGGPFDMQVESGTTGKKVTVHDVLVGEVYLCSGQSNMNWTVYHAANPEQEIAAGKWPAIRHFKVPERLGLREEETVDGQWEVCSPATVGHFTAVGYFFAREIHRVLGVPVGLIHASWGGTMVEAWMSRKGKLRKFPHIQKQIVEIERELPGMEARREKWRRDHLAWEDTVFHTDPGNIGFDQDFAADDVQPEDWDPIDLPRWWHNVGMNFNGSIWVRREVDVPRTWAGRDLELGLGRIEQFDTTYFNGERIGGHGPEDRVRVPNSLSPARVYRVPGRLVKAGRNVIAVRVFNRFGAGGFPEHRAQMALRPAGDVRAKPLSLAGPWHFRVERVLPPPPPDKMQGWPAHPVHANVPGVLFDGMIAPLIPYTLGGALWYQGESNIHNPREYAALFPAMIREWRRRWGRDFPFFLVQIASHHYFQEPGPDAVAELREAQASALALPHTGMAVTIDIGNAHDVHPKNKREVGRRLALQALRVTYGKKDVAEGPRLQSAKVKKGRFQLQFKHAGNGLKLRWGKKPAGFVIAGSDGKFFPAIAELKGKTITAWHPGISKPRAIRYAWGSAPAANVINGAKLPLAPFRFAEK
ncbi:MAG TPA: sialate O-acetylesterase [Candidatus Methylacidiphilales bacterium]|jgi:sialate O-acetylesterase|nr:sialate O-acetylesterase [Candidatus Methylacidiphilales bacterium]